jgi:hypothetical protein
LARKKAIAAEANSAAGDWPQPSLSFLLFAASMHSLIPNSAAEESMPCSGPSPASSTTKCHPDSAAPIALSSFKSAHLNCLSIKFSYFLEIDEWVSRCLIIALLIL